MQIEQEQQEQIAVGDTLSQQAEALAQAGYDLRTKVLVQERVSVPQIEMLEEKVRAFLLKTTIHISEGEYNLQSFSEVFRVISLLEQTQELLSKLKKTPEVRKIREEQ